MMLAKQSRLTAMFGLLKDTFATLAFRRNPVAPYKTMFAMFASDRFMSARFALPDQMFAFPGIEFGSSRFMFAWFVLPDRKFAFPGIEFGTLHFARNQLFWHMPTAMFVSIAKSILSAAISGL